MLNQEIRSAILALHQQGHSRREIAQSLRISRNSVRGVIKSERSDPGGRKRTSQLEGRLEEIRELYTRCEGNLVRVVEKLKENGCTVSYSTLTWYCRDQGIGVKQKVPSGRIITGPGEEMQHDTSPYTLELGGKKVLRHCASLVLGYSRMIFIRFYPKFDRFHCKIFLTEAFQYFGGSCRQCVIDNSSIVIACGAGRLAQVAPEIEAFERRFGFRFLAHELGHADRKGKVERDFWYVERNFLAGRRFKNDGDLNRQAAQWMDQTANPRRIRELKASPIELFAAEKSSLIPLPLHVPEVYQITQRLVDAYGCISLHSMKYPVPANYISKTLMVRETADKVIILDGTKEIVAHVKKVEGSPVCEPPAPRAPRRQTQTRLPEESDLQALGEPLQSYLPDLKTDQGPRYFWSVRKLHQLFCQYKAPDFIAGISIAAQHRLFDVRRIETIILQEIAQKDYFLPLSFEPEDYQRLPQYQQGESAPAPDLDRYLPQDNNSPQPDNASESPEPEKEPPHDRSNS